MIAQSTWRPRTNLACRRSGFSRPRKLKEEVGALGFTCFRTLRLRCRNKSGTAAPVDGPNLVTLNLKRSMQSGPGKAEALPDSKLAVALVGAGRMASIHAGEPEQA